MSEAGRTVPPTTNETSDDDAILRSLGYVPSAWFLLVRPATIDSFISPGFKREFSNLSTVCIALETSHRLWELTTVADIICIQYYGTRSTVHNPTH